MSSSKVRICCSVSQLFRVVCPLSLGLTVLLVYEFVLCRICDYPFKGYPQLDQRHWADHVGTANQLLERHPRPLAGHHGGTGQLEIRHFALPYLQLQGSNLKDPHFHGLTDGFRKPIWDFWRTASATCWGWPIPSGTMRGLDKSPPFLLGSPSASHQWSALKNSFSSFATWWDPSCKGTRSLAAGFVFKSVFSG